MKPVGVDLGTTNSAICGLNNAGKPEVIPNAEGQRTTPSVVQIRADGSTIVGDLAKREVLVEKENTAHFFKRDIGTGVVYEYHGRTYTPVDLSAEVLKKLKADAEAYTGESIAEAVITVPAYFHNSAREETRRAGEMAGLNVLQIINEPTAAALAYGFANAQKEETILVYDLGGGTFDISLVRVSPGSIEVIGTDGNHSLGGKDWDDRLLQYVADQFRERHGVDPLDDSILFQDLLIRVEDAKKALTSAQKALVTLSFDGIIDRIEVTRDLFEQITSDLLTQTEMLVGSVLEETRHSMEQINSVLMVGGSTRMPACRRLVATLTGKAPNLGVNPDECVAIGAAIQAGLHRPGLLRLGARHVRDVTSHSMGMIAESATRDRYVNSILIPRNLPIPARQSKPFQVKTTRSGAEVSVYVTQGESEDPANCSYVGKYRITGIPPSSGAAILDISYQYDLDGVVKVDATLRPDGRALNVEKHPAPDDMSWVTGSPKDQQVAVEHTTVYAAIDLSGSMSGKPLSDSQAAILGFINNIDLAHASVGLIRFADEVKTDIQGSQNNKALSKAIHSWKIGDVGGGNAAHPFDEALSFLKNEKGRRLLVVLTDGVWYDQPTAIKAAKKCHQAGIEVIALGFGGADKAFLKEIASADSSALYQSSGELISAFEQIAQVVVERTTGIGRL
jgi:molecular chaperone DnaK